MEFTFKHTGKKLSDITAESKKAPDVILGIKTPLRPGKGTSGLFGMHSSNAAQVRDNIKNLLLTNHGERVGQFDFGANLQELVFELHSPTFDSQVIERVKRAVAKFMPYITLQELQVSDKTMENLPDGAAIKLRILYDAPDLAIVDDGIEIFMRIEA